MLGAGAELAAKRRLIRRLAAAPGQSLAEPYETGRAGAMLRVAEVLTAGGLAGALLGRRSRAISALSGASLLAASALTRFGIFEAGMASARDPKYTIVPQRQRSGNGPWRTAPDPGGMNCRMPLLTSTVILPGACQPASAPWLTSRFIPRLSSFPLAHLPG